MKKKRILAVDDVRETLLALRIRLEYAGYEVYTATDGEAGLNMAKSLKPDMILLDVMLPKIDGISICRLLKFDEEYASIPIIIHWGCFQCAAVRSDHSFSKAAPFQGD